MEDSLIKEIPFHSLIIGPTKSGKTRYLTDLLSGSFKDVFDFIILICPTFSVNDTWQNFPGINHERFYVMAPNASENDEIEECLQICHDLFYDNKNEKVLVILDDCAVSNDVKKRSSKLVDLAFSGRHINISVWILTQQLTSISKPFRENVCFIVYFNNPDKDSNDLLFKKYGSRIKKEDMLRINQILEENKYSRICFSNNSSCTYEVQIPNWLCNKKCLHLALKI